MLTAVSGEAASAADEVVAKLVEQDRIRQSSAGGYAAMCRYVLEAGDRKAEMMVRWTRQSDGLKQYEIVSEQGDSGIRKHVFPKQQADSIRANRFRSCHAL